MIAPGEHPAPTTIEMIETTTTTARVVDDAESTTTTPTRPVASSR